VRNTAAIVISTVVAAALVGGAAAGVPSSAVKTTGANEQNPAATPSWFAWTESPADHPNRTNVWAEPRPPIDGTDEFRVNPPGTRAWTGGIEDDELVYQELESGDSDIRRFDLGTQQPLANAPINTNKWEWHPSISEDSNGDTWIMFGRQNTSNFAQRILAYNVSDGVMRELQETTRSRYSLIPGQVNGDWATWTACRPSCQVRHVNLLGGPVRTVPRPNFVKHQYGSSISQDGTVYFVRSGARCGASVKLVRRSAGSSQVLVDLPDNRDIFFTYASDELDGTHAFYDRVRCGSGAWNIYEFVD
jgi:hypothetical protein